MSQTIFNISLKTEFTGAHTLYTIKHITPEQIQKIVQARGYVDDNQLGFKLTALGKTLDPTLDFFDKHTYTFKVFVFSDEFAFDLNPNWEHCASIKLNSDFSYNYTAHIFIDWSETTIPRGDTFDL